MGFAQSFVLDEDEVRTIFYGLDQVISVGDVPESQDAQRLKDRIMSEASWLMKEADEDVH